MDDFNDFLVRSEVINPSTEQAAGRLRAEHRKIPCSASSPIAHLASKLVCADVVRIGIFIAS